MEGSEREAIYQLPNGTHIAIRQIESQRNEEPSSMVTLLSGDPIQTQILDEESAKLLIQQQQQEQCSKTAVLANNKLVVSGVPPGRYDVTADGTMSRVNENGFDDDGNINLDEYLEFMTIKCRACHFFCTSKSDLLTHVKAEHLNNKKADDPPSSPSPSSHQDLILSLLALAEKEAPTNEEKKDNSDPSKIFLCGQCSMAFAAKELCREHMVQKHQFIQRLRESNVISVSGQQSFTILDCHPEEGEEEDEESEGSAKEKKGEGKVQVSPEKCDPEKERKRCPRKGCNYRFSEEDLKIHLACHAKEIDTQDEGSSKSNNKLFSCFKCAEKFMKWRPCAFHLWRYHQLDIDLLSCPVCKVYKTIMPAMLDNHMKIHSEERLFKCDTCDKSFKQLSQLKNHTVTHLDKASDMIPMWYAKKQCDLCKKFFSDSKCLKKHVQAVHSKLKPYICQVCNHQSSRKAMLDMHMRQHTGDKPYKCDVCTYRTGDHNSLRRHKMRHTGHKPYQCPFCGYGAIQSSSFKKHIKNKHLSSSNEGTFICNICDFSCGDEESFFSHISSQHPSSQLESKNEDEMIIEVTGALDPEYVVVTTGENS